MFKDEINTNFQWNGMPKRNVTYDCFLLIVLDSVTKVNEKYCPQTFLEACKYKLKKRKKIGSIMILTQTYLMNLIMWLIVRLIVRLIIINLTIINVITNVTMNLKSLLRNLIIINLRLINLLLSLKIKAVF